MGTALQWSTTRATRQMYTISASASAHGSIDPTGAVSVAPGQDQAFTIRPAVGYLVSSLVIDNDAADPATSYTFHNVQGDHSIRAFFAEEPPIEP